MKQFISLLLILLVFPISALAGDVNVDGGGGGNVGSGTSGNHWVNGEDGVRVTVVREKDRKQVTNPIDFANKEYNNNEIDIHFGYKDKLRYKQGYTLKPSTAKYKNKKPTAQLPKIISTNGTNNVASIKKYFADKNTLKYISTELNFPYETLINGEYVLLIEPLVYLKYDGKKMAMTATEVAYYDVVVGNHLAQTMGSLTHANLPTSMYLESSTLGFDHPTKPIPKRLSDAEIIRSYGLGTVHFRELAPGDGSGVIPNPMAYTYRTNTEVITSIKVYTSGKQIYTPDKMGEVTFNILGKTYTKKFICPPNDEELVYVRWTTPDKPMNFNIDVNINGSISQIAVKIVELKQNTPPDPLVTDTNKTFKVPLSPNNKGVTSLDWTQWRAYWQEDWTWIETAPGKGEYIDLGSWVFSKENYNAKMNLQSTLKPADSVKTAIKKDTTYEMKSGYGVQMILDAKKTYNSQNYDVTSAGNAMTFFPEFGFKKYNRVLEKDKKGLFLYKKNEYSFAGENSHYTPLWYPDNKKYEVQAIAFDMWTPAGMLYDYDTDYLTINGNVYDDVDVSVDLIDMSKK